VLVEFLYILVDKWFEKQQNLSVGGNCSRRPVHILRMCLLSWVHCLTWSIMNVDDVV